MAKFSFNGLDEISASFEQLANLSDQDRLGIIMAGANVLVTRQKEKIVQMFRQRTGKLADSIKIKVKDDGDGSYAYISPEGKHPGSGTGRRKRRNGRSNGKYSGSNAEVAYILNYGSPRISATHWLENANEEAEDEVMENMQAAWDDVLDTKGL
jgi:HK97 gp10 family phage protein